MALLVIALDSHSRRYFEFNELELGGAHPLRGIFANALPRRTIVCLIFLLRWMIVMQINVLQTNVLSASMRAISMRAMVDNKWIQNMLRFESGILTCIVMLLVGTMTFKESHAS